MLKKLKFVYIALLLIAPLYLLKVLIVNSMDVATIKINTYTIISPEAGQVEKINYSLGESVSKNSTLISLQSKELSDKLTIINSNISIITRSYLIEQHILNTQLNQAKNNLAFQQKELDRYKEYRNVGAVSLVMMSDAISTYNMTKLATNNIQNQLLTSTKDYQAKIAELSLQQSTLNAKLESLNIKNQESGIISKVLVDPYQYVTQGMPLLMIDSNHILMVHSNKILNDVVKVQFGWITKKCTATNISNQDKNISIDKSVNTNNNYIISNWQDDDISCTLQISNNIMVVPQANRSSVIDIDVGTPDNSNLHKFNVLERLDNFHEYEKNVFFKILKNDFLCELKPTYDLINKVD